MKELNLSAYNEYINEEEQTALLFFSRKTCHVCQSVHPIIDELENEFNNILFYHIDSETNEELMNKCKVKGVPQLLFFKDGEEIFRMAGNHTFDEFADSIEEYLND